MPARACVRVKAGRPPQGRATESSKAGSVSAPPAVVSGSTSDGFGRTDADAHMLSHPTIRSYRKVGLKPSVPECEARRIPLAPPSVVQFSCILHNSPSPEVLFSLLFLSADVAPARRHARVSRSRCTTHPSTCTLLHDVFFRTYKHLR
jgi:hypothetical protein